MPSRLEKTFFRNIHSKRSYIKMKELISVLKPINPISASSTMTLKKSSAGKIAAIRSRGLQILLSNNLILRFPSF